MASMARCPLLMIVTILMMQSAVTMNDGHRGWLQKGQSHPDQNVHDMAPFPTKDNQKAENGSVSWAEIPVFPWLSAKK